MYERCTYTKGPDLGGGVEDDVAIIYNPTSGERLVRKSNHGKLPVNASGFTGEDMFWLDTQLMPSTATDAPVDFIHYSSCNQCGDCECALSPFVEGKSLDQVLRATHNIDDVAPVIHSVLSYIKEKGYFQQNIPVQLDRVWDWYLKLPSRLEIIQGILSSNNYGLPLDVVGIFKDMLQVLTSQETISSAGFFPYDLNLGNILADQAGVITIIDQIPIIADPVIVPIKLATWWNPTAFLLNIQKESPHDITRFDALYRESQALDQQVLAYHLKEYERDADFAKRYHAAITLRQIESLHKLFISQKQNHPYFERAVHHNLDLIRYSSESSNA